MNVLITRPDERGLQLANALAEKGIFAIHQPLFTIEKGRELATLPSIFSRLSGRDYVFAVSRSAVDFAADTLKETGFSWRSDLSYFAVGQGTANYFCAAIEQAVHYPIQSENSEGLLLLPEMQQVDGKNIVILRADSGREFFSEQMRSRGAIIQTVECYQRIMSNQLGEQLSLAKRSGIDTIIATSGEILSVLLEQTVEEDKVWLFECRVVVIGQRMAELAKGLGWKAELVYVSEKADNNSLLEFLSGM